MPWPQNVYISLILQDTMAIERNMSYSPSYRGHRTQDTMATERIYTSLILQDTMAKERNRCLFFKIRVCAERALGSWFLVLVSALIFFSLTSAISNKKQRLA